MDTLIVAVFCLVDDMLKAMRQYEDPQTEMRDAEVMTTAIMAMLYFSGNYTHARNLLASQGYVPRMLSKSRFSRRLHRIKPLFLTLFALIGEHWKSLNANLIYSIDTFPIPVCDNYRIRRARLYQGMAYRGYVASKKHYFYGLKLHLMVTEDGQPFEFFLSPGSFFDGSGLYAFKGVGSLFQVLVDLVSELLHLSCMSGVVHAHNLVQFLLLEKLVNRQKIIRSTYYQAYKKQSRVSTGTWDEMHLLRFIT